MTIHFVNKSGSFIEQYPINVLSDPIDKNISDRSVIYSVTRRN